MIALMLALGLGLMQFEGSGEQMDQAQLARRIRETLAKIDEALLEATEVDAVTDQVARARQMHIDNIRDIEKLIESLEYQMMNPPPSGGGSGGKGGSGQGSGRGQPQPQQSDGSQSEQGGAPEQGGQGEHGEQEPSGQEQQPQGGGRPQDGMSDQRAGDQPPPPDDIAPFERSDTDGRWGLLPPKVQEQLNNLHVDDVPSRYRDWLDAYVKAMRRLEEP